MVACIDHVSPPPDAVGPLLDEFVDGFSVLIQRIATSPKVCQVATLALLALHVARDLDRPPDKPRNLAKDVTVE